jgi:antitoxin component YwqK of YwqJK toxin-antitoxin module
MNGIKSSNILKEILSYLNENKKLEIILYNKQLQKRIEVDINDYKNISKRYKFEESNGCGKEYIKDTEIIIFDGNYLNGKRNGKGKEYYTNGNIKFDGEYLNGKKIKGKGFDVYGNINLIFNDGKIVEKYDNGKLKFVGDYCNCKRWNGNIYNYLGNKEFTIKYGKGIFKEYYTNGNLEFEGEFINGLRNGKGKEYNIDGILSFEGVYVDV